MTKKYWSRARGHWGRINTPLDIPLFAYLDSPASSGDLVVDWPEHSTVLVVSAVTWIPIIGAATG